ncbi:DUF7504 family protein [Natronosalvus vescus]|uniref:DUF7504 family protein n=1 Tax=Natronosalvus vescus TaxID=2953881 RepID=UPI003CCD7E9D
MVGGAKEFVRGQCDDALSPTGRFVTTQLESLKRKGCNILVTGNVPPEVSFHATRNLFGDDQCERSRQRILACTDLHPPGNHYLWTGYESEPELISSAGLQRSISRLPSPRGIAAADLNWISEFQMQICEAIAEADATTDGLEPSQLRMSVMTLRPTIETVTHDETDRFLRVLTHLVEGVSGMAHYHLPVDDEDELVTRHADHFDIRIELRNRDHVPPESRWHFPDCGKATRWHQL